MGGEGERSASGGDDRGDWLKLTGRVVRGREFGEDPSVPRMWSSVSAWEINLDAPRLGEWEGRGKRVSGSGRGMAG